MSDERKHIDELFKSHLVGHQAKAPENAWNRLHADLHGKRRAMPLWYFRAAAAAVLLLLAFAAGYYLAVHNSSDESQLASDDPVEIIMPAEKDTAVDVPAEAPVKELSLPEQETEITRMPDQPQIADNRVAGKKAAAEKAEEKAETDEINYGDASPETLQEPEIVQKEQKVQPSPRDEEIAEEASQANDREQLQEEIPAMDPEMLKNMLYNEEALAQDILKKQRTKPSAWSLGAQVSPVYSYRSISGDMQIPDESVGNDYFEDVENGIVSIAGGISLDYRVSDRLSLGSGLFVSRIGQENNDVLAYNNPGGDGMYKLATSAGTVTINPRKFESVITEQQVSVKDSIPGDYIVNASMVQNLDYLEVPLILKYKMLNKKFTINVMGGLSPGILVNNRSYFDVEGEKVQTGTTENINPVIYNSLLGVGLEYAISKKVSINMEPTFKYSLSPVNSGSGLRYQPYSLSWFTGISYKLQ
ncbi:MAG: outer membrane beta-barrel protein [Bacteroidales bacterium]